MEVGHENRGNESDELFRGNKEGSIQISRTRFIDEDA